MLKINSDRLELRRYTLGDAQNLFDAAKESFREVSKWLPWCHENYSIEDAITWITLQSELWNKEEEFSFAIYDTKSEKFVGGVGINQLDRQNQTANLGYWVRTSYTGKGIATEAALLTAKYGFDQLYLETLDIVIELNNLNSKKVAQKLGAKYQGIYSKKLPFFKDEKEVYLFKLNKTDIDWLKVNYII